MKRKTLIERQELRKELQRLGITENVLINWNRQKTAIPKIFLDNERDFLQRYLTPEVKRIYNL